MSSRVSDHRRRFWLGWLTLLFVPAQSLAVDNIWQSSLGQTWFDEVRGSPGEHLAGIPRENTLTPGNVYHISFQVEKLRGSIGLLLGDLPSISIHRTGTYAFDFAIAEAGERRMLFETRSANVAARVDSITVTQKSDPMGFGAQSSATAVDGDPVLPGGHYWSFDKERNLMNEMVIPLANPDSTTSYRLSIAQGLHDALTTPGARGFWFTINWRTVEIRDGVYNWSLIDDNVKVARDYGLKAIVSLSDRSFDGSNVLPQYFPSQYVISFSGGGSTGIVAKRWDPYVYKRMIRLYKAIAKRFGSNPAFAGIATSETALGQLSGGDYTLSAYREALIQLVTQSQSALKTRKLLFYLNFLLNGDRSDMNKDARVSLLRDVPHGSLLVGAPDITPDFKGIVRSVSPYRIHIRKNLPALAQFCHLQHIDLGHRGTNVKDNQYRLEYAEEVRKVREREADPSFSGEPAVFEFDDVGLHPQDVLGELWQPQELLDFGRRNFGCSHILWHHRNVGEWQGASWRDIQQVILQN